MSFSRRLAAGITTVGASFLIVLAPSGASAATGSATAADVTTVTGSATAADVTTATGSATAADVTVATATEVTASEVTAAEVTAVEVAELALTPPETPATTEPAPAPTTEPAATSPAPQRGNAGYGGTTVQELPDGDVSPATGTAPATTPPVTTPASAAPDKEAPTRGGPGYTPTPSPSVTQATPDGVKGSEKPAGVKSATKKVRTPVAQNPVGLKDANGGELPVTGATVNGTLALGGLLVAGGVMAVWFTRRRRSA